MEIGNQHFSQMVGDKIEMITLSAWMIQDRIGNRGKCRHLFLISQQAHFGLTQDATERPLGAGSAFSFGSDLVRTVGTNANRVTEASLYPPN